MIELENFGAAYGIANDFGAEIRLAEIDVENADSEGWQRGEKCADSGARDGIALREGAETDGVSGTGEGDPVFGKFHKVPSDIFGDLIFGLALDVDCDFDGAGRMNEIALDAIDVEAAGFEMPESFLTEAIVTDAAGDDAGVAEDRGDVGEIGWSAAKLLAGGEKIPEKFAESDDDGARGWGAGAHELTDGRKAWARSTEGRARYIVPLQMTEWSTDRSWGVRNAAEKRYRGDAKAQRKRGERKSSGINPLLQEEKNEESERAEMRGVMARDSRETGVVRRV